MITIHWFFHNITYQSLYMCTVSCNHDKTILITLVKVLLL